MKKAVLLLSASLVLLASCKENDIPLVAGANKLVDTTYVEAQPETPQPHAVLLEEFTGASCSNCPSAHVIIDGLKGTYGTRLNVISIHPNNNPQGKPQNGATYNFTTQKGTDIGSTIYNGILGMPEAGVDRTLYSQNLQLTDDAWPSAISARTPINSGINLSVTSRYNAAAGNDTIAVTIAYTQAMTTAQNLTIAIVEDSLYDLQEDLTNVDKNYLFTDVFRDLVTANTSGELILPNNPTKEAGRVVQLHFLYPVDTKVLYNPKNCRVIAFVTSATGKIEVLQSAQANFAGQ